MRYKWHGLLYQECSSEGLGMSSRAAAALLSMIDFVQLDLECTAYLGTLFSYRQQAG